MSLFNEAGDINLPPVFVCSPSLGGGDILFHVIGRWLSWQHVRNILSGEI